MSDINPISEGIIRYLQEVGEASRPDVEERYSHILPALVVGYLNRLQEDGLVEIVDGARFRITEEGRTRAKERKPTRRLKVV